MPQVTAAQELQIKAQMRLASLMEEKLVTRISVLSTLLGGGKTTERLLVRISIAIEEAIDVEGLQLWRLSKTAEA